MKRVAVPAAVVIVSVTAIATYLRAQEDPAATQTGSGQRRASGPNPVPGTNATAAAGNAFPVATNAPAAATNTTGALTGFGGGTAQAETESRERALSLLKNRLVKERVEHVLQEFVDIGGYFRAGYGRNDQGTSQSAFQAPRSEERRVGKECRSRWSPYH